jgi:hypothetical protein
MSETNLFSKIKSIQDLVSSTFQLKRLEKMSGKNHLIAICYTQLIANINYCILNVGSSNIVVQKSPTGNVEFPNTVEGKLDAIAESFKHMSDELDGVMAVGSFTNMMQGVGVIGDIVHDILSATVKVNLPAGKEAK